MAQRPLGCMIVESLTKQVNGTVEFRTGQGAEVTVMFPLTLMRSCPAKRFAANAAPGANLANRHVKHPVLSRDGWAAAHLSYGPALSAARPRESNKAETTSARPAGR